MRDNVASELFMINACSPGKLKIEVIPCQYVEVYFRGSESRWREKERKKPESWCDSKGSKEYEKNRSRKFSAKWQVGRPWLQHDQDKGMICKWCIENKATLMAQNVFNSDRFIDGCTSYKAESIAYDEKSAAHLLAQQCHKAKIHPEKGQQI